MRRLLLLGIGESLMTSNTELSRHTEVPVKCGTSSVEICYLKSRIRLFGVEISILVEGLESLMRQKFRFSEQPKIFSRVGLHTLA